MLLIDSVVLNIPFFSTQLPELEEDGNALPMKLDSLFGGALQKLNLSTLSKQLLFKRF